MFIEPIRDLAEVADIITDPEALERLTADIADTPECRLCLGAHDPAVHDATLSIHQWFRFEVTRTFQYFELPEETQVVDPASPSRPSA